MEMVQKTPKTLPPLPLHLQRRLGSPHQRHASKRDHSQSPSSALLPQSSVSCPKILRRTEGYYRSLPPKQAHPLPHVSHAGRNKTSKLHPSSLLFHLNRPVRSIPSHSDPPQVSKVPFLFPRQQSLFLSSNAFRNQPRTENIHESHHRSTQAPASSEYPCISLHRRFPPLEHVRLHACSSDQDSYNSSHQSRSFGQLGKIFTDSSPSDHLSWGTMVRRKPLSPSQSSKHRQIPVLNLPHLPVIHDQQKTLPAPAGNSQFPSPLSGSGKTPPPPHHPSCPIVQEKIASPHSSPVEESPPLVAGREEPLSTSSHFPSSPNCHLLDRRIPFRLGGSLLPRSLRLRMLDTRGEAPAHQHPGMSRSPQKLACLTTTKPILHPNPLGQHGRCIPHKQAGLQQKQVPNQSTALPPPTLRESPLAHNGASHSRTPELLGRLPLQGSPHQSGMGTQPTVLQTTSQPRSSPDRPLCPPGQRKTPSLRVPLQSPSGDSNRLPLLELEPLGSNLPLPTPFSAPSLPSQAGNLLRRRHPDRSSLTRRSMVASVKRALRIARSQPRHLPDYPRQDFVGTRSDVTTLSRIQFLTKIYSASFSPDVAATLTQAHRASTASQYERSWKNFQLWLQKHPDTTISKKLALQYLHHLAQDRQLNPKTVLVYRNALHLPLLHGFGINTKDQEFSLLARAQFIQNPPRQRIVPTWNPNKVLSMLEQPQFELHRASSHFLLMKTLFLVALATGNRVSELAAMTRIAVLFTPDKGKVTIPIRPGFLYKNQSLAHSPPNIIIRALLNKDGSHHRLCPVNALHCWLNHSQEWGSDAVFLDSKSHCPLNSGRISSCLVRTINLAIPRSFAKAHDVRKISASLAWARGVPPQDIIRNMFWKSSTVFVKKYLIPLPSTLTSRQQPSS